MVTAFFGGGTEALSLFRESLSGNVSLRKFRKGSVFTGVEALLRLSQELDLLRTGVSRSPDGHRGEEKAQ